MDLRGLKLLIWDIDGVLIYVRESYREAIVETARYYVKDLMGVKTQDALLSVEDTQKFKLLEGFNDDWKLTYAFVLCLLTRLVSQNPGLTALRSPPKDLASGVEYLRTAGSAVSNAHLELDYGELAGVIRSSGAGLAGVQKALVALYGPDCVDAARRLWFTDLLKKLFQETYLGSDLYEKKYGEKPLFIKRTGLIRHERPIVSLKTLESLSERFIMGVASGRERFEAEYSLKEYGFDEYIPLDYVVTSEDVSHGKPDPESLLECCRRMARGHNLPEDSVKAVYVGDSVDDVRAAKNAGFFSVGCLSATPGASERTALKSELQRLKCDLVISDANHLAAWLK